MMNGVRPWNPGVKARYESLVGNTFGGDNQSNTQAQQRNNGGAGEDRTPYLFNAIEALSQMSYSPT